MSVFQQGLFRKVESRLDKQLHTFLFFGNISAIIGTVEIIFVPSWSGLLASQFGMKNILVRFYFFIFEIFRNLKAHMRYTIEKLDVDSDLL